jgi:protein phosphatase
VLAVVAIGAYFASQTVYFVGTSDDGFVTVYRGMPYDLPAGLHLYGVNYESGVPTAGLTPAQRATIGAHKLRAKDDAQDLVRQLETGQLGGP